VGLRAGLDSCGKSRPPPGFDPRTVQPAGSRYTDYATRPPVRYEASPNQRKVQITIQPEVLVPLRRVDLSEPMYITDKHFLNEWL